jgi:hypothetical protein
MAEDAQETMATVIDLDPVDKKFGCRTGVQNKWQLQYNQFRLIWV